MKAKPRGSTSGLLKHRENQKVHNTAAMLDVIAQLKSEKHAVKWAYKDIWSRAGLKSQIALDSPWNAHVRAEIDAHNEHVRLAALTHSSDPVMFSSERDIVKSLRAELRVCKDQRDQALARIAQFSAETEYFKNRCEDLERTVVRLKNLQ